jgi:hypothetical protein
MQASSQSQQHAPGSAEAHDDNLRVTAVTHDDTPFAHLGACGPRCWGPLQWMALHQMLRGFQPTPERQAALRSHVQTLADVIPCSICSNHWRAIAPTIDTSSRDAALKWSIDVHNAVNKRLHKPELSYEQAIAAMNAAQAALVAPHDAQAATSSNPAVRAVLAARSAVTATADTAAPSTPGNRYDSQRAPCPQCPPCAAHVASSATTCSPHSTTATIVLGVLLACFIALSATLFALYMRERSHRSSSRTTELPDFGVRQGETS